MEKPKASGNWRSPHRKDEKPSVVMHKNGRTWRDYTYLKGDCGDGTCIDLVMYVNSYDQWEAIKELHRFRGLDLPKPEDTERQKEALEEFITRNCLKDKAPALKYLTEVSKKREQISATEIKATKG